MGRDNERYYYLRDVGIEKNSWLLSRFLDDLAERQMTELPTKGLLQILHDHYKLEDRLSVQGQTQALAAPPIPSQQAEPSTPSSGHGIGSRRGKQKPAKAPVSEQAITEDDYDDVYGSL